MNRRCLLYTSAFFMIPSFKPIIAIVIISAIAFGGEAGFLVGAMTMVVSNFLFGQGPWTPWQMFAMGFIGFLSGILYRIGLLPTKRLSLCIYGFLVTVFIYGGIMNPAALFMSVYDFTWEGLLAIYISGIPVDLVPVSYTHLTNCFGNDKDTFFRKHFRYRYGKYCVKECNRNDSEEERYGSRGNDRKLEL